MIDDFRTMSTEDLTQIRGTGPQICFFAPDVAEIAQRRRIKGFRAAGFDVVSVSFTKRDGQMTTAPDWPNLSLGRVQNNHLIRRFWRILFALPKLLFHSRRIHRADLIIARNLDMFILAWITRLVCLSRTPLVYECLDIHDVFTRGGMGSMIARWVERRFLARSRALIVSSPGFRDAYFKGQQRYSGSCHLVENKLWFDRAPPERPTLEPRPKRPLTLGWTGSIRCLPSFELLLDLAKRMPKNVHLEIHGQVHRHAIPNFDERIARVRNVTYHGGYIYPHGLHMVYERLDLIWAQDLWQEGANSNWLLPNRIYEAAWFGCPTIAVSSTQTGQRIDAQGLGWTIPAATPEALVALLTSLTPAAVQEAKEKLLGMPDAHFRLFPEDYTRLYERLTSATPINTRTRRATT